MSDTTPPPVARPEELLLARILPVVVGGETKELRVRTRARAREWKRSLVSGVAGGIGGMNLDSLEDGTTVVSTFDDRMFDLVVEYDETAALGGREWLDEHATDGEIYAIFRKLLEISFPFARDLRTVIAELRALGLADLLAGATSARSTSPTSTSDSPKPDSAVLVASTTS